MALTRRCCWCVVLLAAAGLVAAPAVPAQPPGQKPAANGEQAPPPRPVTLPLPDAAATLLTGPMAPVDLDNALKLAGVQNPEILESRAVVEEAVALRQLAATYFLPNINLGGNLDTHTGTLQQSNGNIIKVNRDSLFLGMGANAIAAGSVNIPGVQLIGNVSVGVFNYLISRQVVAQRQFASEAVRNQVLLRVTGAYLDLMSAQGRYAIARQNREEVREIARITDEFAKAGQGRRSDADRAAAELEQRQVEVLQAEGDIVAASARLCQVLNLDPSTRLVVTDAWAVPAPLVPDPIPLPELLIIALRQRPELKERRAAIDAALLELHGAKMLPFSPNYILGYSTGSFGGGSNTEALPPTSQSRFDNFYGRQDVDVIVYWTLQSMGLGNLALIRASDARAQIANFRLLEVLNRVRMEVAASYARTHARFAQIGVNERAVKASTEGFQQDYVRVKNREGLPIEVLDNQRLLSRARFEYLGSILDYNRAQFELFVALGQPPRKYLARPVPATLVLPPEVVPPDVQSLPPEAQLPPGAQLSPPPGAVKGPAMLP